MNRFVTGLSKVGRLSLSRLVCHRCVQLSSARFASSEKASRDNPIQFTTSDASQWKARQTFHNKGNRPPFEAHIISLSFIALLIYFCILREENDIDEMLNRGLFDHLPELEEQQLKVTLEYQRMHGQDTSAVEARLASIHQKMDEIQKKRASEGQGLN